MEKENTEKSKTASDQADPRAKYVWVVGGIILLVLGWFGLKILLAPFQDFKITYVDGPKQIVAGSTTTFTWRIDGPSTTINHTAIHLGTVSNPGDLGKDVKPADTKYTEMVKDFASGKFDIPLQFIGNIRLDTPGKYYFRAHATVKDKNYWTDEYTLEVKPVEYKDYKVSLVNAPKEIAANSIIPFTWRVEGPPATINHTSVHFGAVSTPGILGKDVKPADTKYTDLVKDFANGKYDIPLQFVGNAKIAVSGTYYYRVHAVINGKNYWTDEYTLEVK